MDRDKVVLWFLTSVFGLLMVPVMAHGENSCDLEQFSVGNVLSSSAMNGNFSCVDGRLGVYEGAIWVDELSGSVGVGTTAPEGKLHVHDDVVLGFGATSCPEGYHLSDDVDGSGSPTQDDTCSSDGLVVTANGNVGIGTLVPRARLTVKDSGLPVFIDSKGSENGYRNNVLRFGAFEPFFGWRNVVIPDGRLGLGTMSPQGRLDVNGAIYQRGSELYADYVFGPEYELESIETHASFMWRESHLPAVPAAQYDKDGREILEVGTH